jgi:hypothetical protein
LEVIGLAYDSRGRGGPPRRTGGDLPTRRNSHYEPKQRRSASQPSDRWTAYVSGERAPAYRSAVYESARTVSQPEVQPRPARSRSRFRISDLFIFLVAIALVMVLIRPMFAFSQTTTNPNDPDGGGPVAAYPTITEIMAANGSALCDSRGEYSDWIEVTNLTGQTINLAGYALSDDIESPDQFVFPSVVLGPGESVIVFANGMQMTDGAAELTAPFRLSRSGESVVLFDPYDNPVDQVIFDTLETDMSYARDPKNPSAWIKTSRYTPGYPNDDAGWQAFSETRRIQDSPLVINEVMTSNNITLTDEDQEYCDWIELYNRGTEAIDLTGYGLSDREESRRWVFPSVTIEPGAYLLVFASGKDRTDPAGALHANFRLNSIKETVVVSNERGIILDSVTITDLASDNSLGRVGGGDVWEVFTAATPGYPNTDEGFHSFQEDQLAATHSPVIISEVMSGNSKTLTDRYNVYSDWIELYNRSSEPVSLAGYGLSDSTDQLGRWIFPDTILSPGQYLVVFASGRDKAAAGEELHTNFSLSSMGEPVVLTDPEGVVVDKCLMSSMPFDMSYGRGDSFTYLYMDSPSPGAANGGGWPGFAAQPEFVLPAGCYETPQQIELVAPEGTRIHYTLNGDDPDENAPLYTGPITISKPMVVRAIGIRDGLLPSPISTRSYFIGVSHTLPIVSITSDNYNLYSDEGGILVMGPNANKDYPYKGANFWQEWEVPAYLEVINPNGYVELSQGFALRIFGAYSRANEAKCFALMARARYGGEAFRAAVFPNLPFNEYQSLVLRNGASEWNVAKMRDVMITSLVADTTDLDVQAFRPTVLYLNAQYQGVYYFREKLNKHYISQHYGVSPESVNILVGNWTVQTGSNADYKEMLQYAKDHDLSIPENYAYMETQMDIDNYIDFVICEMYCGNTDTGNIKYWMSEEYDGKWRWFFYDVDWAFLTSHVQDDMIADFINPEGNGSGNRFDNTLIRKLLKNNGFKQKFLKRFAYHINVTFNVDRVIQRIDEIEAMIDAEMPMDKQKWGWGTYEKWKRQVQYLRDYASQRPDYVKKHIRDNFGLSPSELDALLAG